MFHEFASMRASRPKGLPCHVTTVDLAGFGLTGATETCRSGKKSRPHRQSGPALDQIAAAPPRFAKNCPRINRTSAQSHVVRGAESDRSFIGMSHTVAFECHADLNGLFDPPREEESADGHAI